MAKKKKRKRLRKDACPSIFKDLPFYYTQNNHLVRSELSTSSSRFKNEAARLEEQNEVFLNADKVESFKDLIEKLPEELHRQKYILHLTENGADLICLSDHRPYTILSAVFINIDMEVTVYNNEQIVPSSSYNHIMPTSKVTMVSQVSNLLAFAKNLDLKKPAAEEQFKANMFKLINSFLLESENEQQISILKFFMEQIDLAFSNKYSRKYSSSLLMMAYVIFATSPRAYERLVEEKILIFPSKKTLKKITLNLDSKTGIDDKQYLTLRFSQLNAFDRMLS